MLSYPDATLKAFFSYLTAHHIKLGIEALPLVAAAGQPGYGVESFGAPGNLETLLSRIKSLGGALSDVAWDEPWYYGYVSTGIYSLAGVAAQVAAAVRIVQSLFPNALIGDIEPVGTTPGETAQLQAWLTAYDQATGQRLNFFQADVAYWEAGWQGSLASTIAMVHADGIPADVIVDGLGAASTDTAWATQAVAAAQLIESDPRLRPNAIIVQSWQTNPSEAPSATTPGTLASVATAVAAGQSAALTVPAVAQYSAAGVLVSVAWSGGWVASQDGSSLKFLSPSGQTTALYAWSSVENFAFNPQTAILSLTIRTLPAAAQAAGSVQSTAYAVSVTPSGFNFATAALSPDALTAGSLTLSLAASSATGFPGSGITNQPRPALAGTAPPGATVSVSVDGVAAGSAVANALGAWTDTLPTLTDGAHVVQAALAGQVAPDVTVVSVDTAQPTQPTLTLAPGSDSGFPGDGITSVAQPVLTGVADAGVTVSVTIDGKVVGTAVAGSIGQWVYDLSPGLALGAHAVSVTATNRAGTVSTPAAMQLVLDTAAQEAAVPASPDPLFDAAWYLQNHPAVAASGVDPYTQFMTVGWKAGYDPDPYFSTQYYLSHYPSVAAAGVNPLLHYEQYGWAEGLNPSATFNTNAYRAANPSLPATEDPLVAFVDSQYYSDAIVTAAPALSVALLHDTGASAADGVTRDPTLAITAAPGDTVSIAVGAATPSTFAVGSAGSWSQAYAAATLADGSYTVTVTAVTPAGATTRAALAFTLDRTAPAVTAVTAPHTEAALGTGAVVTITVRLSEAVWVTGEPTLSLNDGGVAYYAAGSGSSALSFRATVAAGQNTPALAVTGSALPGTAAITDAAGNPANLAGVVKAVTGPVAINTLAPGVTAASSPLAGTAALQTVIANGNGQSVDAGAGSDAVTLSAGNATLMFHGNNDTAFLGGSGAPVDATVDDQSKGLTVALWSAGQDVFRGFAADPSAVVQLMGGVGGYTSVLDVMAALAYDGHGGAMLPLGHGQAVDFLGVVPGALHPANFQIG